MSKWQSMDTAPKDGRLILGWNGYASDDTPLIYVVYWEPEDSYWQELHEDIPFKNLELWHPLPKLPEK